MVMVEAQGATSSIRLEQNNEKRYRPCAGGRRRCEGKELQQDTRVGDLCEFYYGTTVEIIAVLAKDRIYFASNTSTKELVHFRLK